MTDCFPTLWAGKERESEVQFLLALRLTVVLNCAHQQSRLERQHMIFFIRLPTSKRFALKYSKRSLEMKIKTSLVTFARRDLAAK